MAVGGWRSLRRTSRAEQARASDGFQRPLRSRFQPRLTRNVGPERGEFDLRRFEREAFLVLLAITLSCGVAGLYMLVTGQPDASKWIASAGLFATVTGVVQLELSGLFEKLMKVYGDEEKYPYGPPSNITRQIIDNPDRPVATWFRNVCFFNVKTGFWLIVVGTLAQVVAVWV